MKNIYLDKNNNKAILLAGILSLIIAMGIARFSYTSLLPMMLEKDIDLKLSGILASFNYVGYLSGAVLAIFIKRIYTKVILFRIGMILSVLSTAMMGIVNSEYLYILSRIIAGFGSAMGLVVGSSLVMYKLNAKNKTKLMGIHFAGVGAGIIVADIIIRFSLSDLFTPISWQNSWIVLSVFAFLFSLYPMYILQIKKDITTDQNHHGVNKELFSFFVIALLLSYFCAGVGFVINGTFLPTIFNSIEQLKPYSTISWIIVGITAIPSSIIWAKLAVKYGNINAITLAFVLQAFGVLIPTFSTNVFLNLFGAFLYGSTFIGHVTLFLALGGKLAGKNPVILMGALTAIYSLGQIFAPLYAVELTNYYNGDFTVALYVTAFIVTIGGILIFVANMINDKKNHTSGNSI